MKFFVFLISLIFIAGTVLGPIAMNHLDGHESCGITKAQGLASCFEFLSNFSAVMINGGFPIFPVLLLIFLIITAIICRNSNLPQINLILWRFRFSERFSFFSKNKITRWLALFENSPAFV